MLFQKTLPKHADIFVRTKSSKISASYYKLSAAFKTAGIVLAGVAAIFTATVLLPAQLHAAPQKQAENANNFSYNNEYGGHNGSTGYNLDNPNYQHMKNQHSQETYGSTNDSGTTSVGFTVFNPVALSPIPAINVAANTPPASLMVNTNPQSMLQPSNIQAGGQNIGGISSQIIATQQQIAGQMQSCVNNATQMANQIIGLQNQQKNLQNQINALNNQNPTFDTSTPQGQQQQQAFQQQLQQRQQQLQQQNDALSTAISNAQNNFSTANSQCQQNVSNLEQNRGQLESNLDNAFNNAMNIQFPQ